MFEAKPKPLDRERILFILMVSTCLLASTSAVVTAWVAVQVARRAPQTVDGGGCACASEGIQASSAPAVSPGGTLQDPDPARAESGTNREIVGQSVGTPRAGALFGGHRLEPGEGYVIRNAKTSYGTESTVSHLRSVIAKVRREHRHLHDLVVGDLSSELGGRLLGHFSHQSGRDVDLGLFYRRRPEGYPERFIEARRDNLHFKATFALLEALADTVDEPGGVEWILLDYELQRMLYVWGKRQKIPAETLDRIFQYPHGPTSEHGLVRHFPQHRNHLHVRFSCGADRHCSSPEGPPSADSPVYRAMLEEEGTASVSAAKRRSGATAPTADARDAASAVTSPPRLP